ncbi:hypothetical protein F5888DRAFT_1891630 [Russula emetica]|nr:hypothetical protein F5888DRAFT_1891630 [Russula emetica]
MKISQVRRKNRSNIRSPAKHSIIWFGAGSATVVGDSESESDPAKPHKSRKMFRSDESFLRSSPAPAPTLHGNVDLAEVLDCARVTLAPVAERQRGRAEQNTLEKRNLLSSSSSSSSTNGDGMGKNSKARAKSLPINIPLHGPRVEVVLAWLTAVWLVELDSVALSESDVVGE